MCFVPSSPQVHRKHAKQLKGVLRTSHTVPAGPAPPGRVLIGGILIPGIMVPRRSPRAGITREVWEE